MGIINEKDETLMSICVDAPWPCELYPDSGEPNGHCVFAKLSQAGYASASLASADGKDTESLDSSCRLVYNIENLNKMRPDCLILVSIIRNANSRFLPMWHITS